MNSKICISIKSLMGCEANVASRPAATSPSPQLTHGRHVISPLLLPYYSFLVLIFVPTLSIFISLSIFIALRTVPICVRQRAEGRGQRSAPAAAAAVPRL